MKGPIWTIAAAVFVAAAAWTKIEISFYGKYMGKEAGFTLFETGNLVAIAALVVASITFLTATMVLLWRAIQSRPMCATEMNDSSQNASASTTEMNDSSQDAVASATEMNDSS